MRQPRQEKMSDGTNMIIVNIHEAKARFSKLVDQAVKGEAFVIAKAGKPLVKVAALNARSAPRRLGFLAGEIAVPRDFNRMCEAEIRPYSPCPQARCK
jgi:antitoxin (DNA-binding transcriptional repressor) of toxin-antitoxin stability system